MTIFLTVIAVIVIFSALVLIHEWGHFIMARRAGIKVLEFGVGFPPRLFGKKIGETTYTVNAIPFGGFVKLFGEDATSPEILKNKKSFAAKSPWVRIQVVVAGVVMNFVLAVFLLTVGFTFGIQPLLVTEDDLFHHIEEGNVRTSPGVFVSKISDEVQALGIAIGDRIVAIDDRPILETEQTKVFQKGAAKKDADLTLHDKNGAEKKIHVPLKQGEQYLGIDLKPFTEFPRLSILEVKPDSASFRAGLRPGDIILQMNGEDVFSVADYEGVLVEAAQVNFTLLREGQILPLSVKLPDEKKVVIADVFPDTVAARGGFQAGDILMTINGVAMTTPQQVQNVLKANEGQELLYGLARRGAVTELRAASEPKKGLGIALSTVASFRNGELSVYPDAVLTSIVEIKNVRYGPFQAFRQSISESVRLMGLTVAAFGRTLQSVFSELTVPADIGGPVQIAYYTHTFVQEGFFALLRFAALLSLSLAVINVLPIPALDGGRLFFIVVEVIFRRRVSARIESLVHGIGFLLLIGLILLVTYSDISKLL